jgi:alpha-glucuronidase
MRKRNCIFLIITFFTILLTELKAQDGYELWLKYERLTDQHQLTVYKKLFKTWLHEKQSSPTISIAENELVTAIKGLIGSDLEKTSDRQNASIVFVTPSSPSSLYSSQKLQQLGPEGFHIQHLIQKGKSVFVIAAREDVGILYGTFHFLRLLQSGTTVLNIDIKSEPKIKRRILNHWDNLDRTVERGYAGFSLWDWHRLPGHIDPRYYEYARANASLGINGAVLTNVNANALILTPAYLEKVAALADVFRPYGIKVYLTARFSAPSEIGGLPTSDPLDASVNNWWRKKVDEIYKYIPDFGGFTVKANSEGQPGPQTYKRTHADGANMLAKALAPHNGIVMWRAFVYDNEVPADRVKQAYNEFKPLDGKFDPNVLIQVKNGPLDFQPREPFHPLFGAMPSTPLMMEFQLTQEYLGFATHLVYLATLFKECLNADTYQKGKGSTVSKVIDGSLEGHTLNAIAGVANIGSDRNWCGHPFAQSNWYAFGRLAWNPELSADSIAREWITQTFTRDDNAVSTIERVMTRSREITVSYMTPLGLHHIMGWSHHYGPAPWIKDKQRNDWTSVYYHRADSAGIGFNRTASGSNALEQYTREVQLIFKDPASCPEAYLLWFHHVSWDFQMKSKRTLWEELCYHYYQGADSVRWMQKQWESLKGKVNAAQYEEVKSLLQVQHKEAMWWRDACVLYFQTFSGKPIPADLPKPANPLSYYESLEFPYAPGIRPKW